MLEKRGRRQPMPIRPIRYEDPGAFLARVYGATFTWRGTPGEGRILGVTGSIAGHSLVRGESVLHAGLFPEAVPVPIVRPVPQPVPLPGPTRR
jgi:hypothetical protein